MKQLLVLAIFVATYFGYVQSNSTVMESVLKLPVANISTCCPPFFNTKGSTCVCKASQYNGLRCDDNKAAITGGYWAGSCGRGSTNLCSANCPPGFCIYNESKDYSLSIEIASISELDDFMCGPTRIGVLCGECRANYSVSYHSYTYTCVPNHTCKYGWLLYIVSELVPLTIVFFLVTAFNISFTSGAINGFILFAQLQDSLQIYANGRIYLDASDFHVFKLIYRFFNFSIEQLPFCLWEGATVLDAMAFKYVTFLCGLVLIFVCTFVLNSSLAKRCLSCCRPTTLRTSMIHGLTAFFVMCYSQCLRVSLNILTPIRLKGYQNKPFGTVLFYSGQFSMFGREHLKYAVPALFFSATFLLLPPLVLILYPLLCRTLSCCNLSETKIVSCMLRLVPVQLLDSFQSDFRDEVRFFAGFCFLYRAIPLITFSIARDLSNFYSTLEVFLICVIALHAIVQPYKKKFHNVVDLLLLTDLALINAESFFTYHSVTSHSKYYKFILSYFIQLVLLYIPLISIAFVSLFKVLKPAIKWCKKKHCSTLMPSDPATDLPPLRDEYSIIP